MIEIWRDVAPTEDLPIGSLLRVSIDGESLCVGHAESGFFALDDFCPHAGGSLADGLIDGNDVVCPQHAYGFDIRSGECEEDPRCRGRILRVRVVDGRIQVRR